MAWIFATVDAEGYGDKEDGIGVMRPEIDLAGGRRKVQSNLFWLSWICAAVVVGSIARIRGIPVNNRHSHSEPSAANRRCVTIVLQRIARIMFVVRGVCVCARCCELDRPLGKRAGEGSCRSHGHEPIIF
jgi:hypothetical protein